MYDRQRAAQGLATYLDLINLGQDQAALSKQRRAVTQRLNSAASTVNSILYDLVPDAPTIRAYYVNQHAAARPLVRNFVDLLSQWEQMTVTGPDGVETLPLPTGLHFAVMRAAHELWAIGHWRLAVNNAAGTVSDLAQRLLGRRDVSDSALMAEAFKPEPPEPGKPRFRCPGDLDSETVRSQQKGAQLFAMGTFQAIRNPAIHWTGNGNPVTGAEDLAALSKVVRWVLAWEVSRYTPPAPDFDKLAAATENLAALQAARAGKAVPKTS